jgi:hypothetical protein
VFQHYLNAGDLPGLGKTVHHAADFACSFLAHDPERVVRSGTGMDDQRLARLFRRGDMHAKAPSLPFEIPLQPIVVEPGLPDGDHLGTRGERHQVGNRRFRRVLVIGVHADGRVEVRVRRRQRVHAGPVREIDTDT